MVQAGLDLSRRRLDFCLITEGGEVVEEGAVSPDAGGLAGLVAAIESMTGARFVHDTLVRCGWEVELADAHKVKGLAPMACKLLLRGRTPSAGLTRI